MSNAEGTSQLLMVRVFGNGPSNHSITTSNTIVNVVLSNVTITAEQPFFVRQSDVKIWLNGTSTINTTDSNKAGIQCSDQSELTFLAFDPNDMLDVTGVIRIGAIGTDSVDNCQSLTFMNGFYVVEGDDTGTAAGRRGMIQNITVRDGLITAEGHKEAGIGAEFGNSTVNQLEILGGEVRAVSDLEAGIGSGSVDETGEQSQVDIIEVRDANLTAKSQSGSGVGSAQAGTFAHSSIRLINILSCDFQLTSQHGVGIGSGSAISNGSSTVEALVITHAKVTVVAITLISKTTYQTIVSR
jgi:hypothetical protein